jgi:hypothetical protein
MQYFAYWHLFALWDGQSFWASTVASTTTKMNTRNTYIASKTYTFAAFQNTSYHPTITELVFLLFVAPNYFWQH